MSVIPCPALVSCSYAEVSTLLQKLLPRAPDDAHSLYFLMCLLQQRGDAEASALAQRIHTRIVHKAALAAQTRRTTPEYAWRTAPELAHLPPDIPIGWRDDAQTLDLLRQAAAVERDRAFLLAAAPDMTTPLRAITETCVRRQEQFRLQTARWFLLPPTLLWSGFTPPPGCALPSGAADDPQAEESARLADLARLAATAADATVVPDAMQRMLAWPDAVAAPFILQACAIAPILRPYAMHALALRTGIQSVHWEEWEEWLQRAGADRIELHAAAASTVVNQRYPDPASRPPAEPTVWDSHIQPFLAANWYIIAGLLMVVAGASLLAYFTWDKSAFVRYLFLPVLLAAFTGGMAELGLRLFRRHEDLRVTGTFLLGGAVCLLPVNFMVLCRAGDDPRAAGLVLPALGLYAALTGFGLWRWCGVMRRELRLLLGAPLLAVNLLAVLGDMPGIREAVAGHSAALVPVTITAAVLLLLAVSNRFLQTVLTRELLAAKLVPWFFGITMAATTAQVAAWRHFHLHITPQPQDYALAAILAGATLLRWERRACELRDTGATYGGESFLGYAALLLGILMAAGNEGLRLAALLLAGVVWLVQAPRRPGVVHYWIGTTLCLLGGASIGLLATAWLTVARLVPVAVWRANGNALATCFGGAGMLGLCLRLFLANGPALTGTDLAGGALLAVTLGVTAWQARAQLPALLAAILLAVILPFFRLPDGVMPAWLYDGSGLTSAVAALALTFACFALRRAEIRRGIQNLFSVPVLVAVVWLSAKALILQFQPHPDQMPFLVSSICLAMTSYAAAIYARQTPAGKLLFHASWLLLGAGIAMGCDAAGCSGLAMFQYPLLWTGVALTVLLAAEAAVARRFEWVGELLVLPRLVFLARASVAVAALLTGIIQNPFHDNRKSLHWLALFLAAQLVWHGLRSSRRRFGAVLFALTASWLCACRDLPSSFGEVPVLLLAVLLADAALEFFPKPRAGLHPLRAPFVACATLLAPVLAIVALFSIHPVDGGMLNFAPQPAMIGLLAVSLLLAARAQSCAGFALPAAAFGYLLCLLPCRVEELCRPWRLSAFALLLCLFPFLARLLAARGARLLRGMKSQLPEWVTTAPQAPWFLGPGLTLAVSAACFQVVLSAAGQANDACGVQVLAPFAAVLAFALAGWYWRQGTLWCMAECLLPLANMFAIAVLWGRDLLDLQLMPVHLVGIAAVLTIAEFAAMRWLVLRSGSQARLTAALRLHYGCAVLAGLTLVLLGMNYISNPDLARIPAVRFAISGVLAFSAGTYFRFAARRPEYLRSQTGAWMESLWHVALGLTLWCGALLIPALRTPQTTLYALSLPAAACWIAAEWFLNIRQTTEESILTGGRFRTSAAAFAMLILLLYVFRLPCQMILFPATPLNLHVYHTGAAAALLENYRHAAAANPMCAHDDDHDHGR